MYKYFCGLIFSALLMLGTLDAKIPDVHTMSLINCEIIKKERRPRHAGIEEGTSKNWSGYAVTKGPRDGLDCVVNMAEGLWIVPNVTGPAGEDAYSAIWVGIDGYSSNTVEQIGTEQDWNGTSQVNYAWFEMYPRGSYMLSGFPVDAGDIMFARVRYKKKGKFELIIGNATKNVYTIVPQKYTKSCKAKRSSAEWIVEAPSNGKYILPLADFGTVPIDGSVKINKILGAIESTHWKNHAITMKEGSTVKASPSALSTSGNISLFSVNWEHQ